MPVMKTKNIAIAASRARTQLNALRRAYEYFEARDKDVSEMLAHPDGAGGMYTWRPDDRELAELDGDAEALAELEGIAVPYPAADSAVGGAGDPEPEFVEVPNEYAEPERFEGSEGPDEPTAA